MLQPGWKVDWRGEGGAVGRGRRLAMKASGCATAARTSLVHEQISSSVRTVDDRRCGWQGKEREVWKSNSRRKVTRKAYVSSTDHDVLVREQKGEDARSYIACNKLRNGDGEKGKTTNQPGGYSTTHEQEPESGEDGASIRSLSTLTKVLASSVNS